VARAGTKFADAAEPLIKRLGQTKNNAEFLRMILQAQNSPVMSPLASYRVR
jgi:hypothetical protein